MSDSVSVCATFYNFLVWYFGLFWCAQIKQIFVAYFKAAAAAVAAAPCAVLSPLLSDIFLNIPLYYSLFSLTLLLSFSLTVCPGASLSSNSLVLLHFFYAALICSCLVSFSACSDCLRLPRPHCRARNIHVSFLCALNLPQRRQLFGRSTCLRLMS